LEEIDARARFGVLKEGAGRRSLKTEQEQSIGHLAYWEGIRRSDTTNPGRVMNAE